MLVASEPKTIFEAAAAVGVALVVVSFVGAVRRARFRTVAVLLKDIARSAA
jgi:hypothetical protein